LKTTSIEESRANEDYPPKMHDAAIPSNRWEPAPVTREAKKIGFRGGGGRGACGGFRGRSSAVQEGQKGGVATVRGEATGEERGGQIDSFFF